MLPRDSRKNPAAANAKPKTGTPAGLPNANDPAPKMIDATAKKIGIGSGVDVSYSSLVWLSLLGTRVATPNENKISDDLGMALAVRKHGL